MPIRRVMNRIRVRNFLLARIVARCFESLFRGRPHPRSDEGGWALRSLLIGLLVVIPGTGCDRDPSTIPSPAPKHLILITVDTLRSDHLGAYGGELELTPEIDRLAEQSVLFTSAYAASSFTLPSIVALLTGRYPEELGIWNNESGVPESAVTIASILRSAGWNTSAVVSNYVLRSTTRLDHSFDAFDDSFTDREAIRKWPERIAPHTTDAALTALDECAIGDDPCFLWIHYQDPHGPYTPPENLRAQYIDIERAAEGGTTLLPMGTDAQGLGGIPKYQFIEGQHEAAFYRAGYDAEIRLMDREVGRLLKGMKLRGLMDETAIVFTADHGEGLGEDDFWFAHGIHLTDVLVRVPLLIRIPGMSAGRRDDVVSLIDVAPTLLPLMLGDPLSEEPDGFRGRNLLAVDAAEKASTPYMATLGSNRIQRYGLVKNDSIIVASYIDREWSMELFDRDSGEIDPSEAAGDMTKKLRRELVEMRSSLEVPKTRVRQKISPKVRANLEALGYVAQPGTSEPAPPPAD
jgi:arylsulfatase A-like enzyme